jgi:hypothetical protein
MNWRMKLALRAVLTAWVVAAAGQPLKPLDEGRVAAVAGMVPAHARGVGKQITDRAAWANFAKLPHAPGIVAEAERIAAEPIPVQPEEYYFDYSKTGDRDRWQRIAFERRNRLAPLVIAECIEDHGRFIKSIVEYTSAFCEEPSWVWPAHDRSLATYRGKAMYVDLGAAELGWQMATTRWLLADRLPAELTKRIEENVVRRIVEPYRKAYRLETPLNWMTITNNWNAVCHSGVVGACLATVDDRRTRAEFIVSAEQCMNYFLSGFTADGYCSEGLGYWNYGFGHFVTLTENVYQHTGGGVDFMLRPDTRAPAAFGARIMIINGVAPAFADCEVYPEAAPQIVWYGNKRFGLGLKGIEELSRIKPARRYLSEEVLYRSIDVAELEKRAPKDGGTVEDVAGLRTWFDRAGILISRPAVGSDCRMGVALKGGHNAEHHNHNDLGSYVVVIGRKCMLLDPGREQYTARTFSAKRYESKLLNSYGHSVPVVAGQLQREGAAARAKVVRTAFTPEKDTIVFDLTSAYPVAELARLERTFEYSRAGKGSLMVSDHVTFKSPQLFGTAMITLGKWSKQADGTLLVREGTEAAVVTIDAGGAKYAVAGEEIKENAPVTPTRIGVDLEGKVGEATVRVTITPK